MLCKDYIKSILIFAILFIFNSYTNSQVYEYISDRYEYKNINGNLIKSVREQNKIVINLSLKNITIDDYKNDITFLPITFIWTQKDGNEDVLCFSFNSEIYTIASIDSKGLNFCNSINCILFKDIKEWNKNDIYTTHDKNNNINGIFNIEEFDNSNGCVREIFEGEIKKINFDESEIDIKSLIIEDANQNRKTLYIYVKLTEKLCNADKNKIYQFFKKGEKLKFECNSCGSGNILSICNVYS